MRQALGEQGAIAASLAVSLSRRRSVRHTRRSFPALLFASFVLLEVFFLLRIAALAFFNPASTGFERSALWSEFLAGKRSSLPRQQRIWRSYDDIAEPLKRAVLAAEDDAFVQHFGVRGDALLDALRRNLRQSQQGHGPRRWVGGSTITQQLAKNLLLSNERNPLRKAEEALLAFALELCLSKRRILEIYLNHAQWGAQIFGAEAAARFYFGKSAAHLREDEAARLSAMLPAPAYFQRHSDSAYLATQSAVIRGRMAQMRLP